MDGVHEAVAAALEVTIGGEVFRLAPLRLRDYAEMEQYLLARRPDPLELVIARLDALPEHLQQHLLSRAYDDARRGRRISVEELSAWLATPEGRVHQFWRSVRQHHPDITLERAEELVSAAGDATTYESTIDPIGRAAPAASGVPPGN